MDVPPVGHIYDATMAHVCHALPLPSKGDKCMESWSIGYMYEALRENAKYQSQRYALQTICRLKMLPLLREISDRMFAQATGKEDLKFVLYSGHDSTVGPLELVLEFGPEIWPPYASRIVLELYSDVANRKPDQEEGLYIKVLFNGRSVTHKMKWCESKLTADGLCPYFVFKEYVNTGILKGINEDSYAQACAKASLF